MEDKVTGTQPGKVEAFEAMNIRIQRSNVLGACRYCNFKLGGYLIVYLESTIP